VRAGATELSSTLIVPPVKGHNPAPWVLPAKRPGPALRP
jgi:hypothetical protein